MAQSKTTTAKKTAPKASTKTDDQPVGSVAVTQQQTKRKVPTAARRVPVQYTPRIPTARCPGC